MRNLSWRLASTLSLFLAATASAQDDPETTVKSSVHKGLSCTDCHVDIEENPRPQKKVNCGLCHDDQKKEVAKSIHAELAKKKVEDVPSCASCHGTHDIFRKTDIRSKVNHLKVDATCLKCHADADLTRRHPDMASADFVKGYGASVHGRAVHLKGLVVAATCSDCHSPHSMRPKEDPESTVHPKNVPKTCASCHQGIYEDWKVSSHGRAESGPVCTTCHGVHDMTTPVGKAFRLRAPNNCGGCHKEELGTYRDTFHGKATSLGMFVAATCSDCHTPHRNLPKSDPLSTVHPGNLQKTCGECHPNASASFVKYNPHADPTKKEDSKLTYYVAKFMHLLILGVFAFFGVHTFLWLQRGVVAMARREFPHAPDATFVRRFSPVVIATHITIVCSFLGLVATGLPLRYSGEGWAKLVVDVLGGMEVTRFIHRFCAIATFGYAVWHVGWLVREVLLRKRFRLLWGPDSLVPRPKDVKDLWDNLKWFFYLGKPPRYGRWTYFEKFDYFAVFWGVPILGVSGLMMWFPGFFTRFLPGDLLNAAVIVHSEEALLAASFIFTIHFFHNHFRPENFPMDTVVFTGRMTLERFKHERPEEYEILVKSNRLNDVIVGPPSRPALLSARIFGTSALLVGLFLIAAILYTFFRGTP